MYYNLNTQNSVNALSLESRARTDKYSVYQRIVNGIRVDLDLIQEQNNGLVRNKFLATYDFSSLSLLGFVRMPAHSLETVLPDTYITATYSYGGTHPIYQTVSLTDFEYGDRMFLDNVDSGTFVINADLITGLEVVGPSQDLLSGGKYVVADNHYIYVTCSLADDSILYENSINLILYGRDEYNNILNEKITFVKNATIKTAFTYSKLTQVVFEQYEADLKAAIIADPIVLTISGQALDSTYKVHLSDTNDNPSREVQWDITNSKLYLNYQIAPDMDRYYGGIKEYDFFNIYELQDEGGTPITPVLFEADLNKPYIYVLASDADLYVYSKYEEYPPIDLLAKMDIDASYQSQIEVGVEYLANGKIKLTPKYNRHRKGKKIVGFYFYYEDTTTTWTYTIDSFSEGTATKTTYNNQGESGFFINPVEITVDPGFYLVTFKTVYDDLSTDIYHRIIDKGYKKALISKATGLSNLSNYEITINRFGEVEIIHKSTLDFLTFRLVRPYFLWDYNNAILYYDHNVTALSWTGRDAVVYSKSGTDLESQTIFGEIDDFGLFAGLTRKNGEDDRSFFNRIQIKGTNYPSADWNGQNKLGKILFSDIDQYAKINDVKLPIYTVTAFVGNPVVLTITESHVLVEDLSGNTLYYANLFKVLVSDVIAALSLYFTIAVHQEITSIVNYDASYGINLVPVTNKTWVFDVDVPATQYFKIDYTDIEDSTIFFNAGIIKAISLGNLTTFKDKAYYFDASTSIMQFNFIPRGLVVNFKHTSSDFDIEYSSFRPLSLSNVQSLLVQTDYRDTAFGQDLIDNTINVERNRWGR